MRLLDWVKNLKWIRAIRSYDANNEDYLKLSNLFVTQSKENKRLREEIDFLKEQIRQMQLVFHAHRSAAAQSIYEAAEAKKDYEQKALNAENSRRPPQ
jgi:hypothetical protein